MITLPQIDKRDSSLRSAKKLLGMSLALAILLLVTPLSAQETIVALGDSNTAGFGVGPQDAYPTRLAAKLRMPNGGQVVNAGIFGDTLGGMASRIDTSVPQGTKLVIVQGGYNDLARGVPPDVSAANLEAILAQLHARHVKAVVCGFFDKNWDALGRKLATRYGATFVPGSTCYDPRYAGPDGLHMTAEGHEVVADRLARVVQPATRH